MIVKTVGLTRTYRRGSSHIVALNNVNMEVEEATFISIVGPSGSGKTTLLNLVGLNDHPTSGKILFMDKDVSRLADKERRKIRLQNIGFVFQTFNLLPTLTALENVELPMALASVQHRMQRKRALKLLGKVGLTDRLQHLPRELSIGETQRVAIARAIANDPSLILADEPTGELDSETAKETVNLLFSLSRERKTTVIVATHDEKIVEVADTTYTIQDGKLRLGS
ncbi:MAG: ABC transporter ATP-binding protein [Candidatus Bathyarchaeota archaeon]|nr:ABC transporter ATP-binding protein [Candidatus Bathyarchaeota archaeon]MDH5745708.1 ABC transporter ATP-binding protein [Candidatus Bathyarchaeota archaeon]